MAKAIRKSEDSGLETSKDLVTILSDTKAKEEISDCVEFSVESPEQLPQINSEAIRGNSWVIMCSQQSQDM